jgi:hypothetical protein
LFGIWQARHAERDAEPGQSGEDRYEKRYLQGEVPGLGVDLDDLVLGGLWLAGELLFELGVADYLSVVLQGGGDLLLLGWGKHGAGLSHAGEGGRQCGQQDGSGERQSERQAE